MKAIANALDVLNDCAEYFESFADWMDGDYGMPEPNPALRLLTDVQRAIDDLRAVAGDA